MRAFLHESAARAAASLRSLRNRGFRTKLRHHRDGPALLLSPHPDDAVLDCWSVLTGPGDPSVVNVFAGAPAPGSRGHFDRLAGARDSAAHMARRIVEDREALARAGRAPVNLGFRALAHRRGRPEPSFAQVDAAIRGHVTTVSTVYAPAGLEETHPDHDLLRCYALALARQGMPVRLYADVPYSTVYGCRRGSRAPRPIPTSTSMRIGRRRSAARAVPRPRRRSSDSTGLWPPPSSRPCGRTGPSSRSSIAGRSGSLSSPGIHSFEVFWPAPNGRP
jgi:hypothetical protein